MASDTINWDDFWACLGKNVGLLDESDSKVEEFAKMLCRIAIRLEASGVFENCKKTDYFRIRGVDEDSESNLGRCDARLSGNESSQ